MNPEAQNAAETATNDPNPSLESDKPKDHRLTDKGLHHSCQATSDEQGLRTSPKPGLSAAVSRLSSPIG